MEFVKCTNCKGTGYVRPGHNMKVSKCPICGGSGKKPLNKKYIKKGGI